MVSSLSSVLAWAALAGASPTLFPRTVTSLNEAAFAEAQQRDNTATRAFSNTQIKTSDGKCLFVDKLSGDFRANLTPVQVAACGSTDGQGWDVITAGKHVQGSNTMIIVSTLTQACFNFDPRRAAGNQVNLFSCGGRADGGGAVTNSQEFAFNGQAGPLQFQPQNQAGSCLAVKGNVLDVASCNTGDATQEFTFGGAAAAAGNSTGGNGNNNNSNGASSAAASTTTVAGNGNAASTAAAGTTTAAAAAATSKGNGGNGNAASTTAAAAADAQASSGASSTKCVKRTRTVTASPDSNPPPPAATENAASASSSTAAAAAGTDTTSPPAAGSASASASASASTASASGSDNAAILSANPTTPVPVSRAGGTLNPTAAAESNKRDDTATRAFTSVTIKAPNGQCLFVDPTAGDFRQNLIPVSLVDCTGSPNEKWDVITRGVHDQPSANGPPAALVVSSLTQGCISFDGRRQAGDTVTLFSCGGRADGSGGTNTGQLFPFIGELSFAMAPVSDNNQTCIEPGNGRLDSVTPCPTDGSQLFSIFP